MKKSIYIKFTLSVFMVMLFYTTLNAQNLMGGLFPTGDNKGDSGPTSITSNSMDINLKNNRITLFGNVAVNNKSTKITADEIIVFLTKTEKKQGKNNKTVSKAEATQSKAEQKVPETTDTVKGKTEQKNTKLADKAENSAKQKNPAKKQTVTSTPGESAKREAKRLVAIGHVIIIKKSNSSQKEKSKEEKAIAGKADYNLKTGIIVLTEDPVLYQGESYIKGDKITLFRKSDRVKVEGNQSMGQQTSKLMFNPEDETDSGK